MGFFRTMAGRLVLLSIAVAFICGGGSALMHQGPWATVLFCVSLYVPVVLNMIGLPRALDQHWSQVVTVIAVLPLLFFLWAVGSGAIREYHQTVAYPFIALGVVALAFAVRPSPRASLAQPVLAPSH